MEIKLKLPLLSLVLCFYVTVLAEEVVLTGKKMELKLKEGKTIFTEGARINHSSFTLTADKIVRYETSKNIEAMGGVTLDSVCDNYTLRGDSGSYSVLKNTGSIRGSPASADIRLEDQKKALLLANDMYYSPSEIVASGSARLTYDGYEVISPKISCDLASQNIEASPLTRMTYKSEKQSAEFSSESLHFYSKINRIKLSSGVSGSITLK